MASVEFLAFDGIIVILKEQVADPQLLIDRLLAILNNPEYCESVYVMRGR
ncbi:unnamed protein product [Trichobilharzia regenti]|nr:unnamed protein product [Trichobilharzia regenti]